MFTSSLIDAAESLAAALARRGARVVFAESCTAGLVSAALARVPGVSQWHCGSAVTYRESLKQDWLGVSADDLAAHTAVSAPVAAQMALGALRRAAEADWSAAITGHLGPHAPAEVDGVAYIALAERVGGAAAPRGVWRLQLAAATRLDRQQEAAAEVLRRLQAELEAST